LLKDYVKIYYWKRKPGQAIEGVLLEKPVRLPYDREPQGEAIAWSLDATKFYTVSESSIGRRAHLIVYDKEGELAGAK
jgi:hypothetical protein